MKHIVILIREISEEKAKAIVNEGIGSTAFGFYPYRDALADAGFQGGEMLILDDNEKVLEHKLINLEQSIVSTNITKG